MGTVRGSLVTDETPCEAILLPPSAAVSCDRGLASSVSTAIDHDCYRAMSGRVPPQDAGPVWWSVAGDGSPHADLIARRSVLPSVPARAGRA